MSHGDERRVAVLGATGFIGRHLITALLERGIDTAAIVRSDRGSLAVQQRVVENFRDPATLGKALEGCGRIVHLADEASRFASASDPAPIAASLAEAISGDRRRVVFASSIYARLDETGTPNAYGAHKREQERLLLTTGSAVGLRLPPVYGRGGGGSFALLDRATARGLPLPFGRADAERSYLSVENLCDLIITLLEAPDRAWEAGSSRIYEPEDASRISTAALARALARRHGRRARLVPIPRVLLEAAAAPFGRSALVAGAFDPLEATGNADLAKTFGWIPADGLPDTIE